jgi:hypothetical protein
MKKSFLVVAIMILVSISMAKAESTAGEDQRPIRESIGSIR